MARLVRRERYLRLLHSGKDLFDVVKVLTGMRRAGKSTLLGMYAEDLRSSGVSDDDIIMINLEEFSYLSVRGSDALNRLLIERIGASGVKYVFLDEIQNVRDWEVSVSALINTGRCDVYLTGSNSNMLSSELATHISGRYVEIGVMPLSFREYLQLHQGDRDESFNRFLRYGSLPEVDPERGDEFCDVQLRGIYNTVLVEDIMGRMGTGDVNILRSIARFLYSNIGNETNISRISKELGMGNDTVSRYLSKLTEAFLFYEAEKYDIVGRKLLRTNGKFYASDLGLRYIALMGAGGTDISRPLENVVYLELLRRGYTVRAGSFRDWEVDFTALKGDRTEYYQVCLSMMSPDTRDRELRPLNGIRDNYPKTVLTMDRFGLGSENGVNIVNVIDWLLDDE